MSYKLVSGISFPFYLLTPGKPDPNVYWEKGQERPRIAQSSQKGPTCLYYAMNLLRERIGKLFSPEYQKARDIEKQCSLFRKNITCLENEKVLIEQVIAKIRVNPNRGQAREILSGLENRSKTLSEEEDLSPEDIEDSNTLLNRFQKFCAQKQSDNLSEYFLDHYKAEYCRIHDQFLKAMGFDPEVMYENKRKKELLTDFYDKKGISFNQTRESMLDLLFNKMCPSWKSLSVTDKYSEFVDFRDSVLLQASGFKETQWNPKQSIEVLIDNLKIHGPLLMSGAVGKIFYEKPPEKVNKVAGRNIYGWKKGDLKKTLHSFGHRISHVVVVIGAEKGGPREGFIYFVDPNDGSEPRNPEMQRIYVTSYQNFKEKVEKIAKFPCTRQSGCQLSSFSMDAYAYYRPSEDRALSYASKETEPSSSIEACVNIDVGFGNSLGMRQDPTWEATIPFTWTPNGWTGQIPMHKEFKFVKVASNGNLQWEKKEGNRILNGKNEDKIILASREVRF